ncbi:MAG: hypothetical protein ACXWPM_00475, partial [Bdellovibrionota bacterium]
MPWCVSFARAPEKDAERRCTPFAAAWALLAIAAAGAVPARAEELPSPAPLDQSFLLLPAYDLEAVARKPAPKVTEPTRVGDSLDFRVGGLKLPGATVALPPGQPAGKTEFEDLGWDVETKIEENGELHLIASPTKAGALTLPSLEIRDGADKAVARTNPISLEVASAIRPEDPSKDTPADLRPPVGLAFPLAYVIALIALGLVALGAAGYFGWRWWERRKARLALMPKAPPKSEDVLALEALEQVLKASYVRKGEYKKHYFSISEILKTYL